MKILVISEEERIRLLMLVRNKLDDTYPIPHRGTLDTIQTLHKLKDKLS